MTMSTATWWIGLNVMWKVRLQCSKSVITSKGQTTLPKVVREALALQPGDRVRYVIREGEVRILPVRPVNRLFGILRQDGPVATLEDMERAIAAGVCDT